VIEATNNVWKNRKKIQGYKIVKEPKTLRHFSAHFKPISK
jgi:tryptophanase